MTDIYVANDPYNWFDRLDKMESDIRTIASRDNIESIIKGIKDYFIGEDYKILDSIDKPGNYRYSFYSENLGESIVIILEEEMNLNCLSLAIHREPIKDLENYNPVDNPNEFFSIFI